jgi:hypothetical protein
MSGKRIVFSPHNHYNNLAIEKKGSPKSLLNRAERFLFPMVAALSSNIYKVHRMSCTEEECCFED